MSRTHGLSRSPLFIIFHGMKARCYNQNNPNYKNYGGRGISICDQWLQDTQLFIDWAIANGWQKGLQIDRIKVNGNYCPENCRFVNQQVNVRNRRVNVYITYKGEEKCLSEWCELLNMNYSTIRSRIVVKKQSPEQAFNKPSGKKLIKRAQPYNPFPPYMLT